MCDGILTKRDCFEALKSTECDKTPGTDQGRIQKFQKGGAPKPNSRKGGGRNLTFQCGFQSFSYKSLTNIPAKGGAAARPAPPLNPRLPMDYLRNIIKHF